jgi:hypothetical protein
MSKTKKIRYIGPLKPAYVIDADLVVSPGETIEVDEALADRLLEQARNWKAVRKRSTTTREN